MASSSVGSNVFAALALLVVSALVLLLLRHFLPLRSTPAYLLLPVFLALALPFSIILLVPIDLASSSGTDTDEGRGIWLPQAVLLVSWRIMYWLVFLLTWIVLPLLGDYSDSGYRDPRTRLISSLRSNGRYQLTVLAMLILGGVYVFLNSGFQGQSPKALVMALAYSWGLVMAIYLMGHGLVAIPRRLFRNAKTTDRLRRLQAHATTTHDKLQESREELAAVEAQTTQLRARRSGLPPDLKDWVDEVVESSAAASRNSLLSALPRINGGTPAVITERYMADLTRKLKRARHKNARFEGEWHNLVDKVKNLEAVVDSLASKKLVFPRRSAGKWQLDNFLTPPVRCMVYTKGIPAFRIAAASVLGLASAVLIWSEVVHTLSSKLSLVGLTVVHHPDSSRGQIGFGGQVISSTWLAYMCWAALYSMSEVKVWGNRALVPRQTYGESACWYSLQVAKLTVPLSFNFITMLPPNVYNQTAFFQFLGKLIDLTPLGKGFSAYFPIFILVPVCATLFNLYGKIKTVFGFGVLDKDNEENAAGSGMAGWREGKALIDAEVVDRSTGPSNTALGLRESGEFRDRPSLDGLAPQRDNYNDGRDPLLLPMGGQSAPQRSPRVTSPVRRTIPDDNDEDDGPRMFFQDLGTRVKNTFDTAERPRWLADVGDAITKPKWLANNNGGSGGNDGNFFKKVFGRAGQGSSDGRVRL